MTPSNPEEAAPRALVDSVLLIDGDNDPHLPPDFTITQTTLVRVFLRTGVMNVPRPLERKLTGLPHFVTVSSPKGGANAADFVMSLHVGILHATLPLHVPFMIVTNDKSLSVAVQELQRIGRQASLWSSHPENRGASTGRRKAAEPAAEGASRSRRGGRSSRRGRRSSSAPAPARAAAPVAAPAAASDAPAAPGSRSLADVAAAYAARLYRIKDPPSRLKTLINDIANRSGASGYGAEMILDELKLRHGVTVDAQGKVKIESPAKAA